MRWAMAALTILRSRSDAPAKKSARRYAAKSMVRTTCASLSWPACDLEKEDSTELYDDEKKVALPARVQAATGRKVALTVLMLLSCHANLARRRAMRG